MIQFISAPFYIISVLCFKLSLLFSYLRIIPGRRWRITIITVAVGCIMFHFIYLVVQMSRCLPPGAAWSPSIATGFCVAPVPFFISMASITMVFDLVVMFLPFPTLWQSRIQKRRKAVLLGLFATGLFITVIQIVRIQTIKNPADFLDPSKLVMWSYIEANLAIVVVCVPTLSPLATYFAEIKTSRTGTTTGTWTGSRGTRAATAAPVPSSSSSSAYALQPWRPDGAAEGRKEGRIVVSREVSVTTGDNADSRNESQESMIQHDHHASQGRIMKKTEFHMVHDAADVV
ncbi:integral membrane protein [Apiospora arundinis]|uniref:Integral membrane protein n=1 Tax=Apiospora arundinis TaxID=335852 RepID=A0ABR2HM41_9PEZI